MPTPQEHKAEAEALLSELTRPNRIVDDFDFTVIAAHARLAAASGTGDHYAAAEVALARTTRVKTKSYLGASYRADAQLALAHAQLAD